MQEIEKYLEVVNDELDGAGAKWEMCPYGAMACLVYQARQSTEDSDAVFQLNAQMREAAERVARA